MCIVVVQDGKSQCQQGNANVERRATAGRPQNNGWKMVFKVLQNGLCGGWRYFFFKRNGKE